MLLEAVIILGILLYCVVFYMENFKNHCRAPGPIRIPPFGNMIQVVLADPVTHVALHKLALKYGDVMSIKLGLTETLIFSSVEPVRQVFAREESSGRNVTGFLLDRNLGQNIGLAMAEGPGWPEARNFLRESLSKYGFVNREKMKDLFLYEMLEYMKKMETESKSNSDLRIHIRSDYFHQIFMNAMMVLVRGERFDHADSELQDLLQYERDIFQNGALGASLIMAYPFLKYVIPETLRYDSQMKGVRGFTQSAMVILEPLEQNRLRERKGEDYTNNPKCFADDFLRKMDEDANNSKRIYTEDHFAVLYADLMQTATDTISNICDIIVLQLMVNSQVQKKLSQEISSVIGLDRLPSLEDKAKMPYTQAVILEGHRWSRAGIFGVPRRALDDFTCLGYKIKKNTVMMFNEHSIFFNEEFWGDPHRFRPERFIDSAKNLDEKRADKISIVFGTGKRACFGQALARDQIFIFVTSLIQKFEFILPDGEKPDLEPVMGMSLYANPYDAIIRARYTFENTFK